MDRPPPPTALPPQGARILAFLAVICGGTAGALIGYAFVDLQCDGSCDVLEGVGMLVGGLVAAIGVAVIVVLALRAMGEWERTRSRT